jgi:ribosomal protein S18 acetylase RimI-like enzyme
MKYEIKTFDNGKHRDKVISLWEAVFGYEADHNAPHLVIDKKLDIGDGLFFIAADSKDVIGTAMAGYDGHRGWICAIAVSSANRKQGLGPALLTFAEESFQKKVV